MKQLLESIGANTILATCKLPITDDRVEGVRAISHAIAEASITDVRHIAYIFATCAHECSFLCIEERKAAQGTTVWEMQKKYWNTGYYGRGYAQITWKKNYEKFEKLLGLPLVAQPELALVPETSAKILVIGMRDGMFSGKKLSDYINAKSTDFIRARRVVNGNFQADRVAAHADRLLLLFK